MIYCKENKRKKTEVRLFLVEISLRIVYNGKKVKWLSRKNIFMEAQVRIMAERKNGKNEIKTNVMRILEGKKVFYQAYTYDTDVAISGTEVANLLGQNPEQVFKTLVTVGKSKQYYVFVVPVACELDLKKAAKAVGEKSIEMIKQKELLGLTGYVHGGCSPIGMKKFFNTTIHQSAKDFDSIIFSAGKIGYQVQVSLEDLKKVIKYQLEDIVEC